MTFPHFPIDKTPILASVFGQFLCDFTAKRVEKPMKIAMIGQKGLPAHVGGIERHVEELSKELVKLGHDVFVFCRSWYVWPIRNTSGIICIKNPTIKTKHLDAIVSTLSSVFIAASKNVDIFHFHGVGPALLCWLPKLLKPKAKVIVTFHCIDRHHQKWNFFARYMLSLGERFATIIPNATITVSKTLETYCRMNFGTNTNYIPNGTQIPLHASDESLLEPFSLSSNNYLLFCARLVKHKGAHLFIEAWKKVKLLRPDLTENKKIAIVGGSAFTDDYVNEIKKLAKDDDSIVLTDNQTGEALHTLYSHSYAFVHPSESEGLPISILEAMSYGKCVLSSDIPENLELTKEYGITFSVGNTDDLVEKIIMILEAPQHVHAVGDEARIFVAKNYDWQDIAEQTHYLYELVMSEQKIPHMQTKNIR